MKKVCRAGFIAVLFVFLINLFFVQGAEVKITGEKGSWKLLVDGKEFYIQGAGQCSCQGEPSLHHCFCNPGFQHSARHSIKMVTI